MKRYLTVNRKEDNQESEDGITEKDKTTLKTTINIEDDPVDKTVDKISFMKKNIYNWCWGKDRNF